MALSLLAPSVPRNVSVVAIDDTRLKVTWFPPSPSNGIIASYQIFYEERLKFSIHNLTRNVTSRGPELSAVIPELTAFTNYTVAVSIRLYLLLDIHVLK